VFRVAFLHMTAASIQVVGLITTDRRRQEVLPGDWSSICSVIVLLT
jgi:hypothetical protein